MGEAVLGIDIGVASVGYVYNRNSEIINSGVYALPSNSNDKFKSGNPNYQTPNKTRSDNRSARRNTKRKRQKIKNVKRFIGGYISTNYLPSCDVTKLKIKGLSNKLTEAEFYSIIINYAKYNGYNELYEDSDGNVASSDYKKAMNYVEKWCYDNGKTVSQYLKENGIRTHSKETKPIKSSVHQEEFIKILEEQTKYYKFINNKFIDSLFYVVYHRRPLKSSKHLRSNCKFENNKKVVTESNIIFQDFRILKELHDLRIKFGGEKYRLEQEIITELYEYLKVNEKLSKKKILNKILDKLKSENEIGSDIKTVQELKDTEIYNKETGETLPLNEILITKLESKFKGNVTNDELIDYLFSGEFFSLSTDKKFIKGNQIRFEIQKVLGTLDDSEISEILNKIYSGNTYPIRLNSLLKYGIKKEKAEKLADLKFRKKYGSYSLKAIKKIMPYMNGEKDFLDEYGACELVYPPKEIKRNRNKDIEKIKGGTLKNPVVERTVNHSIDIINYFANLYPDDDIKVCIELDRSLKKSATARKTIHDRNNSMKSLNEDINKFLKKNKIKVTRNNAERVRLWLEQGGKFNRKTYKQQSPAECIYTGKEIDIKNIHNFEIEHTIPVSVFYDNSLNNKTLCCPEFNKFKDNKTAIEVIEELSDEQKANIVSKIDKYYKNNENKKKSFLKYSTDKFGFPNSFLNNTSYINTEVSKKIKHRLEVIDSNGSITDIIKHITGASDSFINKVKEELSYDGKIDKRIDNRHHALDALILSLTKDKYIKKLNKLNNTKGNIISAKFNNNSEIVKILNDIKNDIYKTLNIKSVKDFNDFINNFIDDILVSIESEKDPIFTRNGSKGVRGSLHAPNPKKKHFVAYIDIDEKEGKVSFERDGKHSSGEVTEEYKLTIDKINDDKVKSIIKESSYKSIEDAFLYDENLIRYKSVKVKGFYYTNPKNGEVIELSKLSIDRSKDGSNLEFLHYSGIKIRKKVKIKYDVKIDDIKSEHVRGIISKYKDVQSAFLNDNYLKNLKEIKLKDRAESYISVNGHIYESGNNHCFIVKKSKGKLKGSSVSLFDYVNGNFEIDKGDLMLKKKDFLVLGYDQKDIKKMIKKGDKSFYKNIYWINKIESSRISITPHNLSSNADDSKIHKKCILKAISSIKDNEKLGNGKFTKIKVDKFCNISF